MKQSPNSCNYLQAVIFYDSVNSNIESMDNERLEKIEYFAAVNTALLERGQSGVIGETESDYVSEMLRHNCQYLDCVGGILNLRNQQQTHNTG